MMISSVYVDFLKIKFPCPYRASLEFHIFLRFIQYIFLIFITMKIAIKSILLQSACSCHEAEREVETKTHMKVIISPSGQPVIITQFDQKLRDLR